MADFFWNTVISESLKYWKIKVHFTQIFNDLVMIIFTLKLLKHVNQIKEHFVITSMCNFNWFKAAEADSWTAG
jgi:hypothetical protein